MTNPDLVMKMYEATMALNQWQEDNFPNLEGRCLEAVRHCLSLQHLYLPQSGVDYPGDTALECGVYLAKHPCDLGKWCWTLLGTDHMALPSAEPCLAFFKDCGEFDGKMCGHVAIVKMSTNHLIANKTYVLTQWWLDRIAYVFSPSTV